MKFFHRWMRRILRAGVVLFLCVLVVRQVLRWHGAEVATYPQGCQITARDGELLRVTLGKDDLDCRPVALGEVSPWMAKALIAVEDQRFNSHDGVDYLAIIRALGQNTRKGYCYSGASTLTTQLAKMQHPRSRSVGTKLLEAGEAWAIEGTFSKDEILEQYLNRAPFGGNIHGVEAAAQAFFGKAAADLSLDEAALLAGLPKAPSRLRPDRYPEASAERRQLVLKRMSAEGMISEGVAEEMALRDVRTEPALRPFKAPHYCDWLLTSSSGENSIEGSLDMRVQSIAEQAVTAHRERLRAGDIYGVGIVVIDVASSSVSAMIGSPDFADMAHSGQVNAALARRSPGSTLKPFVYALGMEQGDLSPESILQDDPLNYKDYQPGNFDGGFSGSVTVREALLRSLNTPVLRVAAGLGPVRLLNSLRDFGLQTLDRSAADYGLGLALGGAEVRLLDLTAAYACLARGGLYQPVSGVQVDEPPEAVRLLQNDTALMIADILSDSSRPLPGFSSRNPLRVAWKTGTSSGRRDAWTVAFNPEYVVGIWVGNADGSPSPALVGAEAAAPLAADIFRGLYPYGDGPWFDAPPETGLVTQQEAAPKLRILSPGPNEQYRLTENREQQLALRAAATSDELYWYINGAYYGTSHNRQSLFWPLKAGEHRIVCSTAAGESRALSVYVQ